MDLTYPPDAEQFRTEIRSWLEENLPDGWFADGFEMTPAERAAFNESWATKLYEGGWICATWPKEYGGKGLSLMQGVVLAEEFARAKAPLRADFFGDTLVGPTILQWGTEEQKQQFLPPIMQGKIRWCQGFSEPTPAPTSPSLGGCESLVEHRASVEGSNPVSPQNLLRISVGLEHVDDLLADLEQALAQA